MQRSKTPPSAETINIAERLLSAAFGGATRLGIEDDLSSSRRANVYRLPVLMGPEGVPASVLTRANMSSRQASSMDGYMEAVGATMRALTQKLRSLWHETEAMEYYPAFR